MISLQSFCSLKKVLFFANNLQKFQKHCSLDNSIISQSVRKIKSLDLEPVFNIDFLGKFELFIKRFLKMYSKVMFPNAIFSLFQNLLKILL